VILVERSFHRLELANAQRGVVVAKVVEVASDLEIRLVRDWQLHGLRDACSVALSSTSSLPRLPACKLVDCHCGLSDANSERRSTPCDAPWSECSKNVLPEAPLSPLDSAGFLLDSTVPIRDVFGTSKPVGSVPNPSARLPWPPCLAQGRKDARRRRGPCPDLPTFAHRRRLTPAVRLRCPGVSLLDSRSSYAVPRLPTCHLLPFEVRRCS